LLSAITDGALAAGPDKDKAKTMAFVVTPEGPTPGGDDDGQARRACHLRDTGAPRTTRVVRAIGENR